ncbi:PREDICTED: cold-regulated 413 inner membrane protein 1, chloroplastic-like [Nelumbo nucifera]|uniref:Cold-regulated 413 inner membrane protein 1, chloroplastic-like n=2 Tax=Nelumbo nucifera TaxID=4432 RepID=A0A1U7Z7T0_NELNU|nr:PREDICTED: cold-regulated 413 inner membrane protein 1, chloroplastic-like [Nelumbo nucifera]
MLSLTLTSAQPFSVCRLQQSKQRFAFLDDSRYPRYHFHPLRVSPNLRQMNKKRRGFGAVCYSAPLTPQNLQWVSAVASAVLVISKGTAVHKSFLVPLFALQAPRSVVSWIKGEYGTWAAFLALLVRLFFFIPGELELPLMALLLVIVAPYQFMDLRGTQVGAIVSLVIAAYLAFQHFSRLGSLQRAFDQGSIIATLAVICITAVPCFLLI